VPEMQFLAAFRRAEIFPNGCSKCLKNKIVHNFLVSNSNGMNQSFPHRQKYNLWRNKIQKENSNFCKIVLLPPLPYFELI